MPLSYKNARRIARQPYKRLARKVPAKTKTYVKKTINRTKELKCEGYTVASQSTAYDVASATKFVDLSLVVTGDDEDTRDASMVEAVGWRINYFIPPGDIASPPASVPVRVVVFQWLENSGTTYPSLTGLGATSTASAYLDVLPNKLTATTHFRYKMLYDKIHIINASTLSTPYSVVKKLWIPASKLSSKLIKYDRAVDTGIGHVFIGAFCNQTDASADDPSILYVAQFKFREH